MIEGIFQDVLSGLRIGKRKGSEQRIFCAAWLELALDEMKFTGPERSEFARDVLLDRTAEFFRYARRRKARKGEMRRERALLAGNTKGFERMIDVSGEGFQMVRGLHVGPQDTRMFFVGKEPEPAKVHFDRPLRANASESASHGIELVGRRFADEFERHVQIFRAHPARFRVQTAKVLDQRGEIVSHRGGNLQRDKKAHRS